MVNSATPRHGQHLIKVAQSPLNSLPQFQGAAWPPPVFLFPDPPSLPASLSVPSGAALFSSPGEPSWRLLPTRCPLPNTLFSSHVCPTGQRTQHPCVPIAQSSTGLARDRFQYKFVGQILEEGPEQGSEFRRCSI